jgi:uncharacterized protein (TIGR02271 family)
MQQLFGLSYRLRQQNQESDEGPIPICDEKHIVLTPHARSEVSAGELRQAVASGCGSHMEERAPPNTPPDAPERTESDTRLEAGADSNVLKLFAEDVDVSRQTVETGRVRIAKVTRVRDHVVDELLARTNIEVERVQVGRVVDAIPAVRDDGDLMVIPIVEETMVVERRLMLKEELHIRRVQSNERFRDTVQLRYQTAEVTRIPAQQPADGSEPDGSQ